MFPLQSQLIHVSLKNGPPYTQFSSQDHCSTTKTHHSLLLFRIPVFMIDPSVFHKSWTNVALCVFAWKSMNDWFSLWKVILEYYARSFKKDSDRNKDGNYIPWSGVESGVRASSDNHNHFYWLQFLEREELHWDCRYHWSNVSCQRSMKVPGNSCNVLHRPEGSKNSTGFLKRTWNERSIPTDRNSIILNLKPLYPSHW